MNLEKNVCYGTIKGIACIIKLLSAVALLLQFYLVLSNVSTVINVNSDSSYMVAVWFIKTGLYKLGINVD